ncbi:MAG: hypothetical protein ACHQ2Z_11260 [Elusimicrobiota bacterium]
MKEARAAGAGPRQDARRVKAMELLAGKMRSLVMAGRFERAFDLGERIMAAQPPAEVVESIMYPLDRGLTTAPEARFYALLSALNRRPRPKRFQAWYVLMASVLLDRLHWSHEAIRESEKLIALPRRYGWMRWHRGLMVLNNQWDYSAARADFRAVVDSAPQVWKAKALLAEIDISAGNTARAFLVMTRLLRDVDDPDRASVRAWRGEMRLRIGQYRRALRDLDWAAARRSPLALCWRGACFVKLERFPEALRDLDAQIRAHPDDYEAKVWRGEARRLMGLKREALEDLDAVCHRGRDLWAHVNRGLVRASIGDRVGLWADYSSLPDLVRHYFAWKLGKELSPDSPPDAVASQLEAMLRAGRGVRRMNQYLVPLWISSPMKR